MTPNGTVTVEFPSPDTAIVVLAGEHDLNTRLALASALAAARVERNIIVDFSDCTFADSFVITSILRASCEQRDARGRLAIAAAHAAPTALALMEVDIPPGACHARRGDRIPEAARLPATRLCAAACHTGIPHGETVTPRDLADTNGRAAAVRLAVLPPGPPRASRRSA